MIVLIDNYDSFSYNLYQLIGNIRSDIEVIRNDKITVKELMHQKPQAIILSPGPGRPEDAGICMEVIRSMGEQVPVLGVCLGHQAICSAYGADISYAKELVHGKVSQIEAETDSQLFAGLPRQFPVGRYHSLAAVSESIPPELRITARTSDGEVMAVEHRNHPVYGVQFHPESILTPNGADIIANFLRRI